jgi:transposase
MMKLQDVILKAMAKKISWLEAAEIIGVCDRTMRRMRERYQEFGYDGLFDQRRQKRIKLRVPMETAERVLALYRDTYFDLSVRHFHEKLREEHAIELSYTWVKQALQGAGLVDTTEEARLAPAAPAQTSDGGDAATHRWQQTSLVF